MPETINYQSILIISVLAFLTPMLIQAVKRVRIPFVVGEILVGLVVGKSFLNIVSDDSWVVFLSDLGLAFLMYLSGLEIDFSQLDGKKGVQAQSGGMALPAAMFALSVAAAYGISTLLSGIGVVSHVPFFTFLLAAGAPGLLVPVFKERGILETSYGQAMLLFSLLCEFICLIAITFISSGMSGGISYKSFLFLVVIAAAVLLYLVARRMLESRRFSAENYRGTHMEVRASFAVMLILVAISQAVGAEIVFGSFIAGVIFSILSGKGREDLREKVDVIGYGFLVPIFFIEVGVNIDIKAAFGDPANLLFIPVILLAFFAVKLPAALLLTRRFGLRRAVSSSFLLSAQLSLMIVGLRIAHSLGILTDARYSAFVLATIISCLLFPLLFDKTFRGEGLEKPRPTAAESICIREAVLANEALFGRPLKEVKFPPSCRIFLLRRGGDELLPTGETVLLPGDVLLMAGVKTNEDAMMRLVEGGSNLP